MYQCTRPQFGKGSCLPLPSVFSGFFLAVFNFKDIDFSRLCWTAFCFDSLTRWPKMRFRTFFSFHSFLSPNRRRKLPVEKMAFCSKSLRLVEMAVFPTGSKWLSRGPGLSGDGGFNNHNMSSMQNPWFIWVVCRELYGTQLFRDLSWIYHGFITSWTDQCLMECY